MGNYRPNPGNNRYVIRKSRREDRCQYDIHKLDPDGDHLDSYYVIVTTKDGEREYTCSCPAYKAFCKHIHWLKYFIHQQERDATIIGGRHFPKDGTWTWERNE